MFILTERLIKSVIKNVRYILNGIPPKYIDFNFKVLGGGGKIGYATQKLVKSAFVCTIITLL